MSRSYEVKTLTYSGQGAILLAERDVAGNPMGFVPVGNVSALTLALAVSYNDMKEGYTGQRGVLKQVKSETALDLSMTAQSFDPDTLSLALYGSQAAVSAGSSVVETIKAYLGKTMPLGNVDISNVVVATTDDVTTYVLDDDYTVNAEFGSITFLTGGTGGLSDGDDVKVTYDHGAQAHIEGLTLAQPERWLRFEGLNTSEGNKPVVLDIYKVGIQPLEEFALINDEFGEMSINMTGLVDPTKSSGSQFFTQKYVVE